MVPEFVVYDPPLSRLPYLAVALRANGTLRVKPFKSARAADAYAARMPREVKKQKRGNKRA